MISCTPAITPSDPPIGDPPPPTDPPPATPPAPQCPSNAPFLCQNGGTCCRTTLEGCTCAAAACEGPGTNCLRDIDSTGCHNEIRPEAPFGYYFCTEDQTCSGDNQALANANCFDWQKAQNSGTYNAFCCGGPKPPPPPPPAPTNLVASCGGIILDAASSEYGYARMQISWNPVPEAVSYMLRVDDGNAAVDRIILEGFGSDTCAPNTHDVCVTTPLTSHSILVGNPASMVGVSWWVSSINASGVSSSVSNGELYSCIPNCELIEGPTTIEEGQTADFTAIFKSNYGQLSGTISIASTGPSAAHQTNLLWPSYDFGLNTQVSSRSDHTFSWDTTGVEPGVYTAYCRAWNDGIAECRGDHVDAFPRYTCDGPSATHTITVTPRKITIPGQVYIGNPSGPLCQTIDPSATEWSGANNMTVSLNPQYDAPSSVEVQTDGSFVIPDVTKQAMSGTTSSITLGGTLPDGYTHSCPATGAQPVDVGVDTPGEVAFYIYDKRDAWWQTSGGNIFSRNSFTATIPTDTCQAAGQTCDSYLSAKELIPTLYSRAVSRNTISAGIPISGGTISGTTSYLTDRTLSSTRAELGGYSGASAENYEYFSALVNPENSDNAHHLSLATGISTLADFTATRTIGDTEIYFSSSSIALAPSAGAISIPDNRKIVVFINGNLTVSPPVVGEIVTSVVEGGNLVFIVSGDIIIQAGVGRQSMDATTPVLSGIFITNGTLDVLSAPASEKKLITAGSFIAHSEVRLNRNFNDTNAAFNKSNPAELFIFRPDLVKNFPDILKSSTTTWKEIN